MSAKQNFVRGDVVRVADDLGSSMSHFRSAANAIVMYSYASKYGGTDNDSLSLMFCDDASEVAWYYATQLTFLRHGGEAEIARVRSEREQRKKLETDLAWIVASWKSIREKIPGATICELMKRIGINNPWGSRGEGITYYTNAIYTFDLLDQLLCGGNLESVENALSAILSARTKGTP